MGPVIPCTNIMRKPHWISHTLAFHLDGTSSVTSPVFPFSGIHGREWISPAVVSYLIREFSERAYKHEHILSNFTIYSIPVLNPDGYEFTHTG